MKFYFDYIFYRMAQFFFKRDGSLADRAIFGVSMIQSLIILTICLIITHFLFSTQYLHSHSKQGGLIAVCITLLFIIYNFRKYKGRYHIYREYWKDELHSQRVKKGYLVLFSLIMPWIMIFLVGIYLR